MISWGLGLAFFQIQINVYWDFNLLFYHDISGLKFEMLNVIYILNVDNFTRPAKPVYTKICKTRYTTK